MADFQKGQTVTFAEAARARSASGDYTSHPFAAGDTAEVTRINRHTLTVRVRTMRYGSSALYSYSVPRSALEAPNGEVYEVPPVAPKPKTKTRKLGEVPEGMIDPKDPRLKWFWDDAAKLADRQGYCSYYDTIAAALGAPGRPRDISVTLTHNGVNISAVIRATSEKEAQEILKAKLGLDNAPVPA